MASGSIDFSKPGKYPVVLSDALLGKSSKETITSIRYNHKADSSNSSPGTLKLKPSDDPTSYDLSYRDQSDRYEYAGSRTSGDGQYVLIFDKVKKHFVLHRVDSTFDMNLVSAPWAQDAETLRSQYPQLDPQPKPTSQPAPKKVTKPSKPAASKAAAAKPTPKRPKVEKPKKKAVKEPTPEPEDDDSDDGLTIEYPGGKPPDKFTFGSTPVFQPTISEPSDEDEDEDAEGEIDEDQNRDVDMLQLPSPANNNASGLSEDEELELDLEAELQKALEGGDSDESEEE